MANKNFTVKNGLEVGGQEVISSSGTITSAALGGQTLGTTDSPSFANITTAGYLRGPASFVIDPASHGDDTGTVVIAGNLQVDGTQTTINSTTMTVDDLNLTLASGAANAAAANGAGITVDIAGATNPSLVYGSSNDDWTFNKNLNVTGNIGVTGTVDGVDIAARDDVLTSTTTTAGAALPKAGGTMTGALTTTEVNIGAAATNGSKLRVNGKIVAGDAGSTSGDVLLEGYYGNGATVVIGSERSSGGVFLGYGVQPSVTTQGQFLSSTTATLSQGAYVVSDTHKWYTVTAGSSVAVGSQLTTMTERMRIKSDGYVGIGTDNPLYKLVVSNNGASGIEFGPAYSGTTNLVQHYNRATSSYVDVNTSALQHKFYNGATFAAIIDSSGNVGIGTATPAAGLQVALGEDQGPPAAGASTASACFGNDTSDDNYGLVLGADGFGKGYISAQRTDGVATTYDLLIQPNGGNVGIGTSLPNQKLSVTGVISSDANNDYYGAWMNGSSASNQYSIVAVGEWYSVGLYMQKKTGQNYSHIYNYNSSHNLILQGGSGGNGEVSGAGNVGIGTTAPATKFHASTTGEVYVATIENLGVAGNKHGLWIKSDSSWSSSNLLRLTAGTGDTDTFIVNPDRVYIVPNVGIGTSSPAYKLDVAGTGRATKLIAGATTDLGLSNTLEVYNAGYDNLAAFRSVPGDGVNPYLLITSSASGITFEENGSSYGSLMWKTSATERMRIHSAGGLSIGTTAAAPAGGLIVDNDIKGNSRIGVGSAGNTTDAAIYKISDTNTGIIWPAADTLAFTAAGAEHMRIDSSGNVGIGTISPETTIDLNGALLMRSDPANIGMGTFTAGNGMTVANGGELQFMHMWSGVMAANDTIVFTYAATAWKSFWFEITAASTSGYGHSHIGGYANNSLGTHALETIYGDMWSLAASNNGQALTFTVTLASAWIHPLIKIKFGCGGGEGVPQLSKCSLVITS